MPDITFTLTQAQANILLDTIRAQRGDDTLTAAEAQTILKAQTIKRWRQWVFDVRQIAAVDDIDMSDLDGIT